MSSNHTARERMALVITSLQQAGSASRARLARRLECEPSRVLDDLKVLESLGLAERVGEGRDTVWRTVQKHGDERPHRGILDRLALDIGLDHLSFLSGACLTEPFARLFEDVEERRLAKTIGRVKQKIHVVSEPARDLRDHVETIEVVLDALLRERTLQFRYSRGVKAGQTHMVEPLTLVLYRRAVYLQGRYVDQPYCYAIDRMQDVRLGDPFEYPTEWRPADAFRECFGIFAGGAVREVLLAFDRRVEPYVAGRQWHASARLCDLPDGRVGLRMRVRGRELERFVLEWGDSVEVLEPPALRQAIHATLHRALNNYETNNLGAANA